MKNYRYSAIETASRCLRKFKLDYLDGLPVDTEPSIELLFGTGLHLALQASLEGEDTLTTFNVYWDSLRSTLLHEKYRYRDYALKAAEFIRKFNKMHRQHLKPHALEKTLTAEIGGYSFEGTPDFVGWYKGVPSIIDFKTSQSSYVREKIICNPQMPLYAELARLSLGFPVEQVVYMVFVKGTGSIQEPIVQKLSPELLTEALDSVISKAKELEELKASGAEYKKNFTSCIMGSRVCNRFEHCYGRKK